MAEYAQSGWIVRVLTNFIGRDQPVEQWFTVGDPDKHGAERAVRAYPGVEATAMVKSHRELEVAEIKTLRLKAAEVRQYLTTRPYAQGHSGWHV